MNRPIIEFLDPDGSYALVQPFDEVRGRVLSSNVLKKGTVLHKHEDLRWTDAAEDLGGFTRLGPSDLLSEGVNWPRAEWEESELLELLGEHLGSGREEPTEDPVLEPESHAGQSPTPTRTAEEDPTGFLLDLVSHTRKMHEQKSGDSHCVVPCRCPAFQVKSDRLRARLQELIEEALEEGRLPRLTRILVALRERFDSRAGAA